MKIEEARKIIYDNYNFEEGSLINSLYDYALFSMEKFWDYYDSIKTMVENAQYDDELTLWICTSYQQILKEFMYHYCPDDLCEFEDFPNYSIICDCIERLDYVIISYLEKDFKNIDESIFELQK